MTTLMDDPYMTRKTLIERAQDAGDDSAWADFVEIYRPYIYTIVRRMNMSHSDAEEIVQQVFVKLLDKLPKHNYERNSGRKFRAWLFRLTKNHTIDFIKARERVVRKMDALQREEAQHYLNTITLPDTDEIAKEEWMVHLTTMAFKRIRSSFKGKAVAAFEMSLQGMNNREIAEKLGVQQKALSTMKKRVQDRVVAEISVLREKYE